MAHRGLALLVFTLERPHWHHHRSRLKTGGLWSLALSSGQQHALLCDFRGTAALQGFLGIWERKARAGKGPLLPLPYTEIRCALSQGHAVASGQGEGGPGTHPNAGASACSLKRCPAPSCRLSPAKFAFSLDTFQTKHCSVPQNWYIPVCNPPLLGAPGPRLRLQVYLTFANKRCNPLVFRIEDVKIEKVKWANRLLKGG